MEIAIRELKIMSVTQCSHDDSTYMAVLKEHEGMRMLPVLMSRSEAHQLLVRRYRPDAVEGYRLMADVVSTLFEQLNAQLSEVRIEAVHAGVTLCTLHYLYEGGEKQITGCRASDGLVLATVFNCPVTIGEHLLELQYMREVKDGVFSMPVNSVSFVALEKALQQAIDEENYELASQLRDEIKRRK